MRRPYDYGVLLARRCEGIWQHDSRDHRLREHRSQAGSTRLRWVPHWTMVGCRTRLIDDAEMRSSRLGLGRSGTPHRALPSSGTSIYRTRLGIVGIDDIDKHIHSKIDTDYGSALRNPVCPPLRRNTPPSISLSTLSETSQTLSSIAAHRTNSPYHLRRGIIRSYLSLDPRVYDYLEILSTYAFRRIVLVIPACDIHIPPASGTSNSISCAYGDSHSRIVSSLSRSTNNHEPPSKYYTEAYGNPPPPSTSSQVCLPSTRPTGVWLHVAGSTSIFDPELSYPLK
jgi:hypothetical protein